MECGWLLLDASAAADEEEEERKGLPPRLRMDTLSIAKKKDTHQKKALLCTYALPSALTKGFPAAAAALDWSGAASGLEKGLEEEEELEAGVAAATSLAGDLVSIAEGGMMEEEEVDA